MGRGRTSRRARARSLAVVLGVDAGASHTEAVVLNAQGKVLARARGPAGAVSIGAARSAARTIAAVARAALTEAGAATPADSLVAGAAGAGRAEDREALEAALARGRLARHLRVITDGEAALESAFPSGPGMVLVAGTGSIAYARGAAGIVWRVGGLGWQLGDEGSGYALGRAALGAAGRAADGRGPPTLLAELLPRVVGVADLDGLVAWAQRADREGVAALAIAAGDAARAGDPVAQELIAAAADELASHVTALLRRVAPDRLAGVALAGGLLSSGSPVRSSLIAALGRVAPQLAVVDTPVDAALGAARLAVRLARPGP